MMATDNLIISHPIEYQKLGSIIVGNLHQPFFYLSTVYTWL